jgi:tRNA(Ile)-lysidine synthase
VLATPVPSLPWAIRTRLVRRFLLATGCPAGALTAEQVERVTALLDGPPRRAEVALPAGRRARREGAALAVRA